MKKKHLLILIVVLLSIASVNVLAKTCRDTEIAEDELCLELDYPSFGGFDLNKDQDINQVIAWGYSLIVTISGLAAFARLVSGGFGWLSSAGNSSKTEEAKKTIESALIGLVLVLSSFLIIKTINPELTVLVLPDVKQMEKTENLLITPSCDLYLTFAPVSMGNTSPYLYISYNIYNVLPNSNSEINLYDTYDNVVATWEATGETSTTNKTFDLTNKMNPGTWIAEIKGECEKSASVSVSVLE